jgi:hypothetical protein
MRSRLLIPQLEPLVAQGKPAAFYLSMLVLSYGAKLSTYYVSTTRMGKDISIAIDSVWSLGGIGPRTKDDTTRSRPAWLQSGTRQLSLKEVTYVIHQEVFVVLSSAKMREPRQKMFRNKRRSKKPKLHHFRPPHRSLSSLTLGLNSH